MNSFFALISRMRYIGRWGLMRSSIPENVQEHSHMVAVIAHALGVIRREVFGRECDPNALAAAALFHDAPEIITGDLPTPVKYHSGDLTAAYKEVERGAAEKLVSMLPVELQGAYEPLISGKVGDGRRKARQGGGPPFRLHQVHRGAQGGQPGVPLRRAADAGAHTLDGAAGGGIFP